MFPMPLSLSKSPCALQHECATQAKAHTRDDGLWDADVQISAIKHAIISIIRLSGFCSGFAVRYLYIFRSTRWRLQTIARVAWSG